MKEKIGFNKTYTLVDDDGQPSVSLLLGSRTLDEYNAAFKAEGWRSDALTQSDLEVEYWKQNKDGTMQKGLSKDGVSRKYTVTYW